MNAAGRNKKCLFLSGFRTVVRKKGMANKPVKNVFFADRNLFFYYKSSSIQVGSFVPCIQMNADANEHCPE